MSSIVQISDFKGFHKLTVTSYNDYLIQSYIDRYEDDYLNKLLGCDLKDLLIADLIGGVPTNPDYLAWFNPFCEEVVSCYNKCTLESKGLKDMLKGFIYYHYTRDNVNIQHATGVSKVQSEISNKLDNINLERTAEIRYNESVGSYKAIKSKVKGTKCYCKNKDVIDYKFLDLV